MALFALPIIIVFTLMMTAARVFAAPCGISGLELNNNGTITCLLGGPGTYATAIALDGPSSLTIVGTGNYILSGVISGTNTPLTINAGAGNKVIYTNAAPSYTGGTTVATGMLQIGNAGTGKIPAAGGVTVNAGATFAFNTTSYNAIGADFLGAFNGAGTISIFGASASQTVQYSGAGGAFAGTYNVIAGARFNPNTTGAYSPSAEYALDGTIGGTMNNTTGKLGALSGASTGGAFQGGSSSGTNGFEIGNKNTNTTFSGAIGGTLFVNKLGTGVFLTNGATTHTGPTTITGGVLGGTGGAASSAHTVTAAGTIMGGTGTGNAGTYTSGNLTFAGSTSKLRVNSNGTNAVSNISSKVTTLNGMTVDLLGALTTPGTYDLITGTSLTGTAVLGTNSTGCAVSLATTATKLQLVVTDCTPPTATINQAVGQADPTAGPAVNFTVVFSEAINPASFTASDITLSGTSTGATVGTPTTSDNITWSIPVTAPNGGTVIANMATGAVTDVNGIVSTSAATFTDNQITIDNAPFTATINQKAGQADPTNVATINYTVVFSEAINPTTFIASDLTLTGTGTGGVVGTPTTTDNITWNVPVTASGNGTYVLNLAATKVKTLLNKDNSAATSTDNTVTYDATALNVTVNQKAGQADPTAANSIFYTVVFSKPIDASTFGISDITLGTAPSSPAASITTFTQLNATTWEFEVKNMANGTTVTASVGASKVKDLAGNDNAASSSTDNSVLYQVPPPNVVAQVTNDTTPTLTGQCAANHNLQISLSGPAAHVYTPVCDGAGNWTLTIPGSDTLPSGSYDIVVDDTTSGSLTNPVANQTSALVIDTVAPTVTVNQKSSQADPTNVNSASFTIVFSKSVNAASFISGDLTVGGTTGTVTTLTQLTPTTWEATITGMTSGDVATLALTASKVTDTAGNNNAASTSTDNSVTYDNTPPAVPVITAPTTGTITSDNTPAITGTGENGAAVTVKVDGVAILCVEGNPLVVASGTWTCTPTAPLANGLRAITALQTDPAGNASTATAATNVTIDNSTPATLLAPDMTAATDSGASNTDNTTSDATPDFTGACTTGDTIKLYADGDLVGQQVCTSSTYTITTSPALSDGPHAITATATSLAGNVSLASPALNIIVSITAPLTPAAPDMTAATDSGTSTSDDITNDSTPDFTGVCTTGETLILYIDAVFASQQVCSGGTYTFTAPTMLTDGSHDITLTTTDAAGNVSAISPALTIIVDTTSDAAPVVSTPIDGSSTANNTPTFTGTGQPGGTVTLTDGVTVVCTASVDSTGNWSCTATAPLADGTRNITVSGTDVAGNATATSSYDLVIDTTAGPPPTISSPADGAEISDTTPTITGLGESGSTITVRDEFGNILCTTTVDNAGNWSCDSTKTLGEGQHQIVATQTDSLGNTASGTVLTVNVAVNTDGITAAVENAAPNNGDGNGDGQLDSEQSGVTSIPNAITGGYATLAVSGGACPNVGHFEIDAESQLAKQDQPFDYPIGLYGFQLECFTVGGTADVTIYLNKVYNTSQWRYRKFDTVTKTYRDINSFVTYGVATVGTKQVTTINFAATDGGPLDEDGVANGVFKDPNGPTITVGNLANTGQEMISIVAGAVVLILGGLAALYTRSTNRWHAKLGRR